MRTGATPTFASADANRRSPNENRLAQDNDVVRGIGFRGLEDHFMHLAGGCIPAFASAMALADNGSNYPRNFRPPCPPIRNYDLNWNKGGTPDIVMVRLRDRQHPKTPK
jgi:hypothetical protein